MEVEVKCGWIPAVRQLAAAIDDSGDGGAITSNDITDATTVGKSVLTATDAAAARTAIGAGTSNLAVGTTADTAKVGNYAPTTDEVSTALKAKSQIVALTAIADPTTATAEDVATLLNAVIAALQA